MECKEIRRRLQDYIDGKCSKEDELEMESHLGSCLECHRIMDEQLVNEEESFEKPVLEASSVKDKQLEHSVDVKRQQQWMKKAKWKHRLSTAFNVIVLFLVVSMLSMILTGVYYIATGKGKEASQVVKTATQMTMPNVFINGSGLSTNVFFTMDMRLYMQRSLGYETQAMGEINGKMLFNLLNVERDWRDGQYDIKMYFMHPEYASAQPEAEQQFYAEFMEETWNALDVLPEGTVAELAISFDNPYEINEIYPFLRGYDLEIVWYAVETGTEQDGGMHGGPYLSAHDIWGVHERSIFDLHDRGGDVLVNGDGAKKEEAFKDGLRLLKENEKLVRRYLRGSELNLEERYDYVTENGVKTYGVVVTGPTKELLRLRDKEQIIYATLGEVDWWNWYRTPASGTIYN